MQPAAADEDGGPAVHSPHTRAASAREEFWEQRARLEGVAPPLQPTSTALDRLCCVFLNGCKTYDIGKKLVLTLPQVSVVCWTTIAEDSAARAFSVGFYQSVAEELLCQEHKTSSWLPKLAETIDSKRDLYHGAPVSKAFAAGCQTFWNAGYRFGDPALYLHKPGHPHLKCPDGSGRCKSCVPPVHGRIVLLRSVRGEVVEKWGVDPRREFVRRRLRQLFINAAPDPPSRRQMTLLKLKEMLKTALAFGTTPRAEEC